MINLRKALWYYKGDYWNRIIDELSNSTFGVFPSYHEGLINIYWISGAESIDIIEDGQVILGLAGDGCNFTCGSAILSTKIARKSRFLK